MMNKVFSMAARLKIAACMIAISIFAVPQAATIPDGAYGVFQCTSIGTSTPVYFSDTLTGQEVVDKENSALIRERGKGYFIGDHYGSEVDGGEWNVNEMRVGEPAFLITEETTYCYECIAVCLCFDNGYDYLFGGYRVRPDTNDIIACGCAWGDYVFLAYYEYTGEFPF